jgi:hypothetical protein
MARIRITIDTEETHKRAFLARASIEGLSPQQLFEKLVEQYCADDLARARKLVAGVPDDEPPAKKPKK